MLGELLVLSPVSMSPGAKDSGTTLIEKAQGKTLEEKQSPKKKHNTTLRLTTACGGAAAAGFVGEAGDVLLAAAAAGAAGADLALLSLVPLRLAIRKSIRRETLPAKAQEVI